MKAKSAVDLLWLYSWLGVAITSNRKIFFSFDAEFIRMNHWLMNRFFQIYSTTSVWENENTGNDNCQLAVRLLLEADRNSGQGNEVSNFPQPVNLYVNGPHTTQFIEANDKNIATRDHNHNYSASSTKYSYACLSTSNRECTLKNLHAQRFVNNGRRRSMLFNYYIIRLRGTHKNSIVFYSRAVTEINSQ